VARIAAVWPISRVGSAAGLRPVVAFDLAEDAHAAAKGVHHRGGRLPSGQQREGLRDGCIQRGCRGGDLGGEDGQFPLVGQFAAEQEKGGLLEGAGGELIDRVAAIPQRVVERRDRRLAGDDPGKPLGKLRWVSDVCRAHRGSSAASQRPGAAGS